MTERENATGGNPVALRGAETEHIQTLPRHKNENKICKCASPCPECHCREAE